MLHYKGHLCYQGEQGEQILRTSSTKPCGACGSGTMKPGSPLYEEALLGLSFIRLPQAMDVAWSWLGGLDQVWISMKWSTRKMSS